MEQNYYETFKEKMTKVGEDDEIIENNEKWFKFFVVLPKITTVFFAVVCFILGIIFAANVNGGNVVILLIFWLGGAVFCALNYAVLKLILSYQILHIYYLKKISLKNKAEEKEINKPSELPEI